jgi:hypothetical protein
MCDFYPVVTIDGKEDSRGDISDNNHIYPGQTWVFLSDGGPLSKGSVPVTIHIGDSDFGSNPDDVVKLTPDSVSSPNLNFSVNLAPCLVTGASKIHT